MTPFPRPLLLLLSLSAALPAPRAAGQNLLLNPGFDHDLSGWSIAVSPSTPPEGAGPFVSWRFEDAAGRSDSGSAHFALSTGGTYEATLAQCVSVLAGRRYAFGGRVLVQEEGGSPVRFELLPFAGEGCGGDALEGGELL